MIIDFSFFFLPCRGGRCSYHVWARVPMLGEDELSVVRDHWERRQIRICIGDGQTSTHACKEEEKKKTREIDKFDMYSVLY